MVDVASEELSSDSGGLGDSFDDTLPGSPEDEEEVADALAAYKDFRGAAAVLRFADGGIELSLAGGGGKSTEGEETVADHVAAMPGDTALLFALAVPPGAFDAIDKADPDGLGADFLGEMLGIDFPEDLETLLGKSLSISLGGDAPDDLASIEGPGDLSIGALIRGDSDEIEDVIAKLEERSGSSLEELEVTKKSKDGKVVIASNSEYADQLLGEGSLSDDDGFEDAVPNADDAQMILYADFDGEWGKAPRRHGPRGRGRRVQGGGREPRGAACIRRECLDRGRRVPRPGPALAEVSRAPLWCRDQLGDQRVRATSVAGSEGSARMERISSCSVRRSMPSRSRARGGLEQRLSLRQGQQAGARQGVGEVRRVVRHLAGQHGPSPQLGEELAVGLEGGERALGLLVRVGLLVVGQQLHLAAQERPRVVRLGHPQALAADDLDVEAAVVVRLDLGQLDERADAVGGLHAVVPDLVALPDRDDPEDPVEDRLDPHQLTDQGAVALLEDVQGGDHAGEHHRVQWEQRHVGHGSNLVRRGRRRCVGRGARARRPGRPMAVDRPLIRDGRAPGIWRPR